MVQTIKAEVSEALAENSGRMLWKFMVTGKGAIKAAFEDLLRRFVKSSLVVDMFKFMFKFIMDGEDYG